jgi:hypothetical protein
VSVAVRPEHGPTLPEILPARHRRAAAVTLVLVVLLIVGLSLRSSAEGENIVRTEPLAFNLHHDERLDQVEPRDGEILRLERRVGGEFHQAFSILPLELPEYRGDVGGTLPILAHAEIAALRERYPNFELVEEGKARINDAAGYQVVYRASRKPRLYGRLVLLPESIEGKPAQPRRGVRLLVEATPKAGVNRPEDAGVRGLTKRPFRAFRFGTEAP